MGTEITIRAEDVEVVKAQIFPGASDAALELYLHDCRRYGIHPLDRLIHPTMTGGKYTPITSIDLLRSRAEESGEYAGSDDPVFRGESEDMIASVTVWRLVQGNRCAFTASARWSEYKPQKDFMWRRMPHTMLGKCAEALALRKAFPRRLGGLYVREELDQAQDRASRDGSREMRHALQPTPEPSSADSNPAWGMEDDARLVEGLLADLPAIEQRELLVQWLRDGSTLPPKRKRQLWQAFTVRCAELRLSSEELLDEMKGGDGG